MKQYKKILKTVLKNGTLSNNRTGVNTISYFGIQSRYDLSKGFPLVTTKKVNFDAIVHELLWFISGDTNIKYLVDNKVNIWNEWPYEEFRKSKDYKNETFEEFVSKIKESKEFALIHGDLGPIYGKQWRDFNGFDQLKHIIDEIKVNPNSRRLIISSWNPTEINNMTLPPCHCFFQFYVKDNRLSCQLYQRSADLFLGVPFNIASYSLLIHLVAKECNLEVGEFIHTIGDAHIYVNHLEQVKKQLKRRPKKLPKLVLNQNKQSIFDFSREDIQLDNYEYWPIIKGKVVV